MGSDIHLSVVIPAYNKESVIEETLTNVTEFLSARGYQWEVIVVDDASADSTVENIKHVMNQCQNIRLLINERNMKKGFTVKRGFLEAQGRYGLFLDADYAYPIDQVDNFLNALENGADIVIGNRMHPDTTFLVKPSALYYIYQRHLLSRVFNLIVKLLLLKGILDTQCGIKAFRLDTTRAIFERLTITSFAFDVELLVIAQQNRMRVMPVPVTYDYIDEPSSVQLFRNVFEMLKSLVQIRINGWMKRYIINSGPDDSPGPDEKN